MKLPMTSGPVKNEITTHSNAGIGQQETETNAYDMPLGTYNMKISQCITGRFKFIGGRLEKLNQRIPIK